MNAGTSARRRRKKDQYQKVTLDEYSFRGDVTPLTDLEKAASYFNRNDYSSAKEILVNIKDSDKQNLINMMLAHIAYKEYQFEKSQQYIDAISDNDPVKEEVRNLIEILNQILE